jgi:Polyketide cyclase / dehydrase and lipid transport
MRYADGPSVEVEVEVRAPVERVWELVADIDVPARFSSEFRGGTWIDAGRTVGARFTGRNEHPAIGGWETTCIVTRWDTDRVFEWAVRSVDDPSAQWRFELVPDGAVVRLRQWCRLGPGPSGLTPAIEAMPDKEERIVARRLEEHRRNMQATVEGIKQLAEGPA